MKGDGRAVAGNGQRSVLSFWEKEKEIGGTACINKKKEPHLFLALPVMACYTKTKMLHRSIIRLHMEKGHGAVCSMCGKDTL